MVEEVAWSVARAEVGRAGGRPGVALLAGVLMGASALTALAGLSWLLIPYPPVTTPDVAAWTFGGGTLAIPVFWILGRLWTWGTLRGRAHHIAMSPHLSPGIWSVDSRTHAGVMMALLCFLSLAFFAGFRSRATGREPFVGLVAMVIAGLSIPVIVGATCVSLARHRRRGGSRFVPTPDTSHWLPGQELAGVLEVRSWLEAPSLLVELVVTTSEDTEGPFRARTSHRSTRVVASATVAAEAFEHPPGLVVVPLTLTVPPDAEPDGETNTGGWLPWQQFRSRRVRWSLRATAPGYEAAFTIAIVAPDIIPTASPAA